jgi:hypothetical protein
MTEDYQTGDRWSIIAYGVHETPELGRQTEPCANLDSNALGLASIVENWHFSLGGIAVVAPPISSPVVNGYQF